ncbi:unnamed protein product [Cunninghamella blakesleeana]
MAANNSGYIAGTFFLNGGFEKVNVENIQVGDLILNHEFQPVRITEVWASNEPQELVQINSHKSMAEPFVMAKTTNLVVIQPVLPGIVDRPSTSRYELAYISTNFAINYIRSSYNEKTSRQDAMNTIRNQMNNLIQENTILPANIPMRCSLITYNSMTNIPLQKKLLKLYHPSFNNSTEWNYSIQPYIVGFWLSGGNNEELEELGLNDDIMLTNTLLSSSREARLDMLAGIIDSRGTIKITNGAYEYNISLKRRVETDEG